MSNQQKMENPTGAGKKPALRVTFDSRLKLEFHGSKVTSDAGLLAYRELDAALGLTDLGDEMLNDWRTGNNTQHSMVALMRQSIFSRLAGYEDTNDAERLSVDPTMRHVVGGRVTTAIAQTFDEQFLDHGCRFIDRARSAGRYGRQSNRNELYHPYYH